MLEHGLGLRFAWPGQQPSNLPEMRGRHLSGGPAGHHRGSVGGQAQRKDWEYSAFFKQQK